MSDDPKRTMFGYAAPQTPVAAPAAPAAPAQAQPQQPPPSAHAPMPAQPQAGMPNQAQPQMQASGPMPNHATPAGYPPQVGYPPQPSQVSGQPPAQQAYAPPQPGYPQAGHPGYAPSPGQPQQVAYATPQAGQAVGQQPMAGKPRRASRGLYLGLHFGGLILGVLLLAWGMSDRKVQELILFAPIPMLIGFISFYVLLYKAWASIQDNQTRTTPGKAVGFNFIPLFSLYWMFISIGSWGTEYNAYRQRHGLHNGFQASTGVFTTHCILILVVGAAAFLITMPMIISQMCKGINSIADGNLPRASIHR